MFHYSFIAYKSNLSNIHLIKYFYFVLLWNKGYKNKVLSMRSAIACIALSSRSLAKLSLRSTNANQFIYHSKLLLRIRWYLVCFYWRTKNDCEESLLACKSDLYDHTKYSLCKNRNYIIMELLSKWFVIWFYC